MRINFIQSISRGKLTRSNVIRKLHRVENYEKARIKAHYDFYIKEPKSFKDFCKRVLERFIEAATDG